MRKIYVVFVLLFGMFAGANAQTTFDWLNTAPDGNWRQGAFGARWNPGGLFDEPPFGVIRFDNNHQLTMNNNVPGIYGQFMMVFAAGNSNVRTISGNPMRLFDFGTNNPKIENFSSANHVINIDIEGDGDAADPLEINFYNTGGLTFNGNVNNQGSFINIFGTTPPQTAAFNGIVSGAGGFGVNEGNILFLNNSNTYTGNTEVNRGELWINTTGDAIANNNIFIGNGTALADVSKIFLSRGAGGTNFTRSFTMNPGNLATRFIGALNTSGTNEFSGAITNNSTNGLEVQVVNAGGTLRCSNDITGTSFISKIGAGIVEYSGTPKTYTGTTIINSGTLRLAAANQIADASRLQLNGGTFSTGATIGFPETLGQLELTENSTIALGTGFSTLTFAASELVPWTAGKTLTITGWNGGCNGYIYVGSSAAHLTAAQLAQINFTGFGTGASLSPTGELRPVIFNNVVVTSTTGTATTAGYATVGDAFTAINGAALHTGDVTISIFNNTTETVAASLNQVAGVTSVLIVPAGCTARTVTGNLASPLIDLNGADNVAINGLNTGGNSLTISNTNIGGQAVRFISDATTNTITNCTITGVNNSATSGVIVLSTAAAGGNDNNTISNNNITAGATLPTNIIYSVGSTSPNDNSGVNILNNNISNFFLATGTATGILVATGNTGWTISGNSLFQTANRAGTSAPTITAININSTSHNGASVTGNFIGGTSATCGVLGTPFAMTGTGLTNNMNGIVINVGTTIATSVQDNTIRNILFNTQSTGAFNAINIQGGNVNVGTVIGNKIGLTTATGSANGSISIQQNTSTSGIFNGIINQAASTGTLVIQNNNISGVTLFTSSANTLISSFYGIRNLSTSATLTISNNLIGSTTMPDNIISTQALNTTPNPAKIFGIQQEVANTNPIIITNNTISNLTYSSGISSVVQIIGVNNGASTSTVNISNNTINNLSNFSPNTGTGLSASVLGILTVANAATSNNINSNTIHTLKNTNTGTGSYSVIGIRAGGVTANTISKNIIQSISLAGGTTTSQQYGITISTGPWTISNNMIRLGIDESGAIVTGAYDIQGINASIGSNSNIYHNSVYIGGTGTGTQVTYAIQAGSSNNVKNNIIVNARNNSTTPNTQIGLLFNGSGATFQDANLYFAPNAGGLLAKSGATNYATLVSLQGVSAGRDINSVNSDPKFVNPTGTAALVSLKINTASATEVESGGLTGLGIGDDFENDVRCPTGGCAGASTKPDMGADEGAFTSADLTPPVVSAFTIPTQANTTAPSVSVTITDNVAVTTTATVNRPRLYYKKCADVNQILGNTNATGGWKYVEATNTTSPFSFNIDYSLLQGGVAAGSFINYFVIAQDAGNNVGINSPLVFASTPSNINLTTANLPTPTNFANYLIQITGGAVTIGTNGIFSNITGACGCFAAVNASTAVLTSNINATVISDLVEDNITQLSATGTSFATAYILNITPSAATMRTISTTIGGAFPSSTTTSNMIGISGNSKVNIDGSFGGSGQYLTFRSTNATAANTYPCIKVNANTAGTSSLTVANSILEGNSTDDAVGLILVNASGNTVSLSATGNDFRDARGGTTGAYNTAIYFNLPGAAQTANIGGNKIYNFNKYGVFLYASGINTINANRFYQESFSASTLARPIYLGTNGATTHTVTNNIIGGSTATNTGTWTNSNATVLFEGISIIAPAATNKGTISGNVINKINLTGTGAGSFSGINVISGAYDITGNTIGDAVTANSIQHAGTGQVTGIYYSNSSTTTSDINTNTIGNITTNTTTNSFGFVGIYVSTSNTIAGNIQGNIIKTISVAPSTTAATAAYGINIGAGVYNVGTTTANNIDGISNSGDGSALLYPYTIGILTSSTTGANTIQGNIITNLTGLGAGSSVAVKGIWVNSNAAHKVLNNTISNLISNSTSALTTSAQPSAAITGIHINSNTSSQQINNNTIFNLSASSATGATNAIGINFTSGVTSTGNQIGNNKIYDIKNLSASGTTARVIGINMQFGGSSALNAVTIFNNMVSLNNNNASTDNRVIGIREAATTFNKYYYNSVNIYGTAAGSATMNSYAFLRDATAATVDLKNNIFQNLRTGGTGKHYAIGNTNATPATGWISTASNYNDLFASNTANVGEWGAGTSRDFGQWKTSSGGDGLSVNSQAYFANVALGDLHLANNNCALDDKGITVAITTDYDGTTRSATPDIGADEFTSVAPTAGISVTGANPICSGNSITLDVTLTGLANWSYTYTINGASPTVVSAVTTSPNTLTLSPTTTTTYALTNLTSGSCVVTSGFSPINAVVTVTAAGSWLGTTSTDWFTASNWACAAGVPTAGTNVTIPTGAPNYPIITTGTASANNITIAAGGSVIVNAAGVFNSYGTITNAGTFDVTAGTLNMAGTSPQTLAGTSITSATVKNLIIGNNVSLTNEVKIAGLLSFGTTGRTLATNDNLTILSTFTAVDGTASVGNTTGNTIVGKASIERYLPAIKSWRYLATPVVTVAGGDATSPTITEAWREGQAVGTYTATGYGTRITGPDGGSGAPTMDEYTQRGSLKSYNALTSTFTEITTAAQYANRFANDQGYFVFVRGDRGISAPSGFTGATNLRMKGQIRTGDQTFSIPATKFFNSFGNPYPSRIDFRTVTKDPSINLSFYVWNPIATGGYNVGRYEVYVRDAFPPNDYKLSVAPFTVKNFIESGEAVFIQDDGTGGTIMVKETDKSTGSANVSRTGVTSPTLEISLHGKDAGGNSYLADGVQLNFDNSFNNGLDKLDVKKVNNSFDNLSVKTSTSVLAVERRKNLVATDSIFLNLSNTRVAPYRFEIDPSVLSNTGLEAFLEDKFLQTATPVSLTAVTNINFDITTNAASRAADRFMIVFKQAATVNFTTIAATRNADKTITVNWGVQNERNVSTYSVEHSTDGVNFSPLTAQTALANNGTNPTYSKLDVAATSASNWYRVKANMANASAKYSGIAMVGALPVDQLDKPAISVNPNPVKDQTVNIKFTNKVGEYKMALVNNEGRVVYNANIVIASTNVVKTIVLGKAVAAGQYQLILTTTDGKKEILNILVL
jgi:hypothetical protein